MMRHFRIGPEHSIERAMIGRRSSETEIESCRGYWFPEGHEMQDEPNSRKN